MILAGLFTPWWIILAAPTGRCFLSWTSSTVHSHRAAPEAHRPFPPVSPRPPRTFHDLSLFFIPFPPPMLLRRSSSRFERCALRSRLSLIARWKFRFASLRNCDPLNRAAAPLSLSLSLFEDYFSIIFRCSYRSRKEEHIFLCPVFSSRSIEAGLRDRSSILQSRASFQFKIRGFSPRFIRIG